METVYPFQLFRLQSQYEYNTKLICIAVVVTIPRGCLYNLSNGLKQSLQKLKLKKTILLKFVFLYPIEKFSKLQVT